MSLTGTVAPDVVSRIGVSLVEEMGTAPARAFADGPVDRVGAILNYAQSDVRDDILGGLEQDDAEFADEVRRAIFTFANIPERISNRDIPKIQGRIDQQDLVTAVAGAGDADKPAVAFFLENISKRLAENINDEAKEMGSVKPADAEAAMMRIVNVIRELEAQGEIFLVAKDD